MPSTTQLSKLYCPGRANTDGRMMPGLWSIRRDSITLATILHEAVPSSRDYMTPDENTNKIRGWMQPHSLIPEFGVVFAERTGVKPADDPGNSSQLCDWKRNCC